MSGHALVEFVVPLVRQAVHTVGAPPSIPPSSASAYRPPADAVLARMRPPGTDWLFVKLYVESERAEALLAGTVRQFCNAQLNAGRCASWFFIRYSDPDPHLGIRLRGDPNRLTQDLLPKCARGVGT
jgi:hypothetical protein